METASCHGCWIMSSIGCGIGPPAALGEKDAWLRWLLPASASGHIRPIAAAAEATWAGEKGPARVTHPRWW